jgi:hypothetical protein
MLLSFISKYGSAYYTVHTLGGNSEIGVPTYAFRRESRRRE